MPTDDEAFVRSLVRAELRAADDLDPTNDLEYLLGLVGDALTDINKFETDAERARWVIAQWCQEVGYHPDLTDYDTGQTVPLGTVPDHSESVWQQTLQEVGSNVE